MTDLDDIPEPDRIEGAPHPRETAALFGQDTAERSFLDAFNSGKPPHAWLITGPEGVGKATLAWRIARFLLARPADAGGMFAPEVPTSLDVPAEHPVARRLLALGEPRLFLLRRAWDDKVKALKTVITIDEARKLKSFLQKSAPDGGQRVVIVDTAEEMNRSTANALLKLLEEPPADTTLLLLSHAPSKLLPTIRSRCRTLRCAPLGPDDMTRALAATGLEMPADPAPLHMLAAGSVGAAIRLVQLDGLAIYRVLVALMAGAPNMDRNRLLTLANSMGGRAKAPRLDMTLRLFDFALARLARTGTGLPPDSFATPEEAGVLARLSPDPYAARIWAEEQQRLSARASHGRAVNLDPAALILDMGLTLNQTAARLAAR